MLGRTVQTASSVLVVGENHETMNERVLDHLLSSAEFTLIALTHVTFRWKTDKFHDNPVGP